MASDNHFYIWIGLRARARGASGQLTGVRRDWKNEGWRIRRHRVMSNGGVNIVTHELATGDYYVLDSGTGEGGDTDFLGYFHTPRFRNPEPQTKFGPIWQQ